MSPIQITQAINTLKSGGVVVFPTDTVWGIGALISSTKGIEKFYQVKGRDSQKPSQVLVQDIEMAKQYGVFNTKALELTDKHWPGALTLVVPATQKVPLEVIAKDKTVGIRCPSDTITQYLLNSLGEALIASSANYAGKTAPGRFEDIDPDWLKSVDYVIPGEAGNQPSSTIVKIDQLNNLEILRQGSVRIDML